MTEDKEVSKAKRQMPGKPGRVGVAHGEDARDLISDEACGPRLENRDIGSVKSKVGPGGLLEAALTSEWACPETHDLKLSNRPVRTRMPGAVGGVRSILAGPYPDGAPRRLSGFGLGPRRGEPRCQPRRRRGRVAGPHNEPTTIGWQRESPRPFGLGL